MINKTSLKFIVGAFLIIGIGVVVLFVSVGASPEAKQEREARVYFENLKEQYENDTYGGDTPEETLALFIEALESGDVELASKYFVIDEQEEWLEYLQNIQFEGQLSLIIDESKSLKLSKKDDERAFFTLANANNIVEVQVIIGRSINNKWKIREL